MIFDAIALGTLLVDGTPLQSFWLPPGSPENAQGIHWGGSWADPALHLEGTVILGPGAHEIEAYGFENCCDGAMSLEALSPTSSTWKALTTQSSYIDRRCAPQPE